MEYLLCNYGPQTQELDSSMTIERVEVPKCEAFCCLGSIMQRNSKSKNR